MADATSNRFTKYFPLLLDALRSADPTPMRPAEAVAWIRAKIEVPEEDLARQVVNGRQSIFENDVHWARFYLAKAGLIGKPKRGLWGLTAEGRNVHLTPADTWALYVRIRDAHRPGATAPMDEEELPAPETVDEEDDSGRSYWFAGAMWDEGDQLSRFIDQGVWENGYVDQFSELVLRMKVGDRIAIKSSFVQKHNLPFDVGGKPASVMRIKATGIVVENCNDGRVVKVAWDPISQPRDWYFYTYRTTLVEADIESEDGRKLIDFTFRSLPQDYGWWLAQPYWVRKYGTTSKISLANASAVSDTLEDDIQELEEEQPYTISDIIADGCFLSHDELSDILERWRSKKNLILQGPPGTGKTWLAKRLGFALSGSNDRDTTCSTSPLWKSRVHPR